MTNLLERTQKLMETVNDEKNQKYLLISDFGTSIEINEKDPEFPFFRIFKPVDLEKKRKINSIYGENFDFFEDSLMDYPTIIHYKLGNNGTTWDSYNRLISVNVARCPLNCWHCYLYECLKNECGLHCNNYGNCNHTRKTELGIQEGWFSAKNIVDHFIQKRASDFKNGIKTNVLRITGGEPFLVPTFILEILQELKSRDLSDEIFVWTETCLIPLAITNSNGKFLISDELLIELAKFNNFCIHPCFHGLNSVEFEQITGEKIDDYNYLVLGFNRLLKAGIDIYPTFGSNVSDIVSFEKFYNEISTLNPLLPLRFALVEYSTGYRSIRERLQSQPSLQEKVISKDEKDEQIRQWNRIIKGKTGYNYADIPRHLVPITILSLISPDPSNTTQHTQKDMIYLFKWPSTSVYQPKLLEIIALPIGAKGILAYNKRWVDEYFQINYKSVMLTDTLFNRIKKYLAKSQIDAFFWILNCQQNNVDGTVHTQFNSAYPFRKLHITNVSNDDTHYYFHYIAGDFVQNSSDISLDQLRPYTNFSLENSQYETLGRDNGFVFLGKNISESVNFSQTFSFESLYSNLTRIESLLSESAKIRDYPLIKILGVEKINPNVFERYGLSSNGSLDSKNGSYLLNTSDKYKIKFKFYQGQNNRSRPFFIDSKRYIGIEEIDTVQIQDLQEGITEKPLNVKFGDIEYSINLPIHVRKPFWKRNGIQITALLIVSILLLASLKFGLYLDNATLIAALVPIVVIFIDKLWR